VGKFPPILRGRRDPVEPAVDPIPSQTRPRVRGGVWRTDEPTNGVPTYTARPAVGELSLGGARKKSVEEYEMSDEVSGDAPQNPERTTINVREMSETTVVEAEQTETTATPTTSPDPPTPENLPPYVPPPQKVVLPAERNRR
jgi:hypothetical protein